jgi:type IV pilus assembly protein PilC
MSNFSYVAIDGRGAETKGKLEVLDQSEALRRIREMGLFPTRVFEAREGFVRDRPKRTDRATEKSGVSSHRFQPWGRVKSSALTVFTRQLATLLDAGMPLLRGLGVLEEQEESPRLKAVIKDLGLSIENGGSLAEAMAAHPKIFNRLYINMVKAGEIGGALETTLTRLAEFMEKSQRIRGKIKAAMYYPSAVLLVALGIVVLLMLFIVPRFKLVFEGLMNGMPLPVFTRFIFNLSEAARHHAPIVALGVSFAGFLVWAALRTTWGRWVADQLKLTVPILGLLFRKAAISRFARTLGTLLTNGVPILQALTIVSETSGNAVVARCICKLHDAVKQGDPLAPTLKSGGVFPLMVAGMVDVGEQTGALPELLMKVADTYDTEVDNAASALTSLLEPLMILVLAVLVGSIVIAVFLPIIYIIGGGIPTGADRMAE